MPALAVQIKDLIDDKYGILCFRDSGWDLWWKSLQERNVPLEYDEIQIPVLFLTEQGYWVHEHINPMYLELECYREINGNIKSEAFLRATKSFINYMNSCDKDNNSTAQVICFAKKYRDICMENDKFIQAEKRNNIDYIIF